MEGGWIKLHRRFLDWEWYGDHNMVILWIHLLLTVNWEEKKWQGMTIGRGQIVCTIASLAEQTGLSVQQVRTALSNMQKTNEINKQTTNKYTVITICNFDRYQVPEDDQQQAVQQTNNTQPNKQITTTKEGKKKEINNISLNAPACTREDKPLESWRFISSVRRTLLGNDKDRIAQYKKDVFSKEVSALADKVGMTQQQQDAFIAWFTEHSPGVESIRAEYDVAFDMESRMRSWVERDQKRYQPQTQQPKSRMDALQDDLNFIHNYFHGNQQSTPAPDEQ